MQNSIYSLPIETITDKFNYDSVMKIFQTDFKRYYLHEIVETDGVINEPTLIGIFCYRVARDLYVKGDETLARVISNLGRFYSGMELYYTAKIGHSLKINHGIGTVVGARSILGNNLLLHHNITIGAIDRKTPIIEDDVKIYPGAQILGGIRIGSNVVIGANAVVIRDLQPNSKVVTQQGRLV